MNKYHLAKGTACAAFVLASVLQLPGQQTPAPSSAAEPTTSEDETVVLSPFIVSSSEDSGYAARYTLAGTRIRTDLKDVGSSISVITSKFLEDTGTTNATQLLVYTPSTEVSGQGGNFLGAGDDQYAGKVLYGSSRVRGLSEADTTRDFFLSDIPWDSYNTGRIDIQRGPNSILFGIGSPAGIINASLNHAGFKNSRKVENRVDNFGTVRFTGDFNQVLIENELAVRVSLLDDHTKFRQEPAFRHDKRVFVAGRYDPKFLNRGHMTTQIEANFEKGNIEANLFRPTPPVDYMTPWFILPSDRQANGFTYFEGTAADADPAGFYVSGAADQLNQGGVILAYNQNQPSSLAFEHSSEGGNSLVGGAFFRGLISKGSAYNRAKGKILGANTNAWKSTYITDRSIFDSYTKLLDGDTKRENKDFKTWNVAFRQSFFNDTLGYELAYDRQNSHDFGHAYLGQAGYGIAIDVMGTLEGGTHAGVLLPDGTTSVEIPSPVNPNFGKAYVVGARGSSWNWSRTQRDSKRATLFYDLDFKKMLGADSKIAKIFGSNRFTGLGSSYEVDSRSGYSSDYNLDSNSRAVIDEDNTYILNYLSDRKMPSRDPAGLNLPALAGYPVLAPSSTLMYDETTGHYRSTPFNLVSQWNLAEDQRTYTSSPGKSLRTINTGAIVWQGYWFGGNLIPLAAYRKDSSFFNQGGRYDGKTFKPGAPTTSANGITFYYPFDNNYVFGEDSPTSKVTSRTYSVVTHTPRFLRDKLPGKVDVQLIYNQSENFQPSPGRTDIVNRPIPDPSGRTKEYGIAISALDDKLYLKVVNYKTVQENTALGDFNSGNISSVAAAEVWARSAAYGHAGLRPTGIGPSASGPWDFQIDRIYGYSSDGHPVTFKPIGPWAVNAAVIGGAPGSTGGGANTTWGLVPGEAGAPGTTRFNYTQAEIDATWARQKAAVDAVLNHPPSDDFLIANGIDKSAFYSPDFGMFDYGGGPASAVVTGSTESEGTELELVANPIRGLSIMLNATRTRAKRTSIAQSFLDYVNDRRPFWYGPAGDMRIWGSGEADNAIDPYTSNFNASMSVAFNDQVDGPISKFLAATDSYVPELHPWAFNVIANYEFQGDGFTKGLSVGAGYRWQDRLVTGYPITHDKFGNETFDLDNPYYGSAQAAVDLWTGYQRKLGRKFKWRMQLNIRNAFANDKLIKAQSNPDGSGAAYRLPEPRTIMLTNTIEF